MANKNIFKEFLWEKESDGSYTVTSRMTLKSLNVYPLTGGKVFTIYGDTEKQLNHFGQEIPKQYNKFEIMEKIRNMVE